MNFALYFIAVGRRSLKPLYRSPRAALFLLILAIVVAIVCIELLPAQPGIRRQDAFVPAFPRQFDDDRQRLWPSPITPGSVHPSCCCWRRVSSAARRRPPRRH
ncbi:hypothetical protein M8494_15745 [Serratia ureilytica]